MKTNLQKSLLPLLLAALLSVGLCAKVHAQGAEEPLPEQEATVDDAEDGLMERGASEAATLWEAAKNSVEGEARRDLAELRPSHTATATPTAAPSLQVTPDDDSIEDIEQEVDQLEESAKKLN
ncbi:MAG: hypothetical protein J0M12_03510 [Deltaproteobacteria bacterium]|nr:hypothetical protein [Deltaproteobacteria bacterium]